MASLYGAVDYVLSRTSRNYVKLKEAYSSLSAMGNLTPILMQLIGAERRSLDDRDREALGQEALLSFRINPMVYNFVNVMQNFLVGPGVEIKHNDEACREEIKAFQHENRFDVKFLQLIARYYLDGEVFPVLFINQATGDTKLREYDPAEVIEVVHDDDDYEETVGLWRKWTQRKWVADTKAWDETEEEDFIEHDQVVAPFTLRDFMVWRRPSVMTETRGFSFLTPVLHYTTQFREFIKLRLNIHRALGAYARFWTLKNLKGSGAEQEATVNTFREVLAQRGAPPPGSELVKTKDVDVETQASGITAASAGAEGDFRAVALQVATGLGIPEFMASGDASNANFASTSNVVQAFIKHAQKNQTIWLTFLVELYGRFLQAKAAAGRVTEAAAAEPITVVWPVLIPESLEDLTAFLAWAVAIEMITPETAAMISPFDIDYEAEAKKIKELADERRDNAPGAVPFTHVPPVVPPEPGDEEVPAF